MTEQPKRSAAEIIAAAKAAKEAQAAAAAAAPAAGPAGAGAAEPAKVGGSPADIIARAKAAAAAKAAAGGTGAAAGGAAAPAAAGAGAAPAGGGASDIIAKAKAAAAAKAAAGGATPAATAAAAAAVPAGGAAAVIAAAKAGAATAGSAPIKPPVAKAGAVQPLDNTAQDSFSKVRRKFVFGFIGICGLATMRFFFPRVLFEPKTSFRIGRPADFPIGVSTKFQSTQRIWVVRDSSSLYVILAVCTHLGCTPDWKESENKFKCPCHGSGFDREGVNFEGPAPKPMGRCKVALTPEGEILVDKATVFGPVDWKDLIKGAYLPV